MWICSYAAQPSDASYTQFLNQSPSFSIAKNLEAFFAAQQPGEFQQNILHNPSFEPNSIRAKLAKKWIANAATRIFNNHIRSFLELVLNACDATMANKNDNHMVGKFGMGFFSILSFLWHTEAHWPSDKQGATITITTAYSQSAGCNPLVYKMSFERQCVNDNLCDDEVIVTCTKLEPIISVHSGQNQKYYFNDEYIAFFKKICSLSYNSQQYVTSLNKLTSTSINPDQIHQLIKQLPTGTLITIQPAHQHTTFSDQTINDIKHYLHYLDLYPYVRMQADISLKHEKSERLLIGGDDTTPHIGVSLTPTLFEVYDAGTGITPNVALEKLLIPSSTTKNKNQQTPTNIATPNNIYLPYFIHRNYQHDIPQSHFLIAVNGVVVVDHILPTPLYNKQGLIHDLVVSMPQYTNVTLARNEIEISQDGNSFEERYLKEVIPTTMHHLLHKSHQDNESLLLALYKGFEIWEQQSAAHHINGRFTSFFKQELEKTLTNYEYIVPVPVTFFENINHAEITGNTVRFVALDDNLVYANYQKLEAFLKTYVQQQINNEHDLQKHTILQAGIDEKLIAGIKIIFIQDNHLKVKTVSSLGTRACLFVPQSILHNKTIQEISNYIIAHVPEQDLQTVAVAEDNMDVPCIITNGIEELIEEHHGNIHESFEQFSKSSLILRQEDEDLAKNFFEKHRALFQQAYWWESFYWPWDFSIKGLYGSVEITPFQEALLVANADLVASLLLERYTDVSNTYQQAWLALGNHKGFVYDQQRGLLFQLKTHQTKHWNDQLQKLSAILASSDPNHIKQQRIINFLTSSTCAIPTNFTQFINVMGTNLLTAYGAITTNGTTHKNTIYNGTMLIWPLPEKTLNALENLFLPLAYRAQYSLKTKQVGGTLLDFWLKHIKTDNDDVLQNYIKQAQQHEIPLLIGLPQFSAPEIEASITTIQKDLAWAKSINNYLRRTINNISIANYLSPIISLTLLANGHNSMLDVASKNKFMIAKESLFSLYNRYFTIDSTFFPKTYGDNIPFQVIDPEADDAIHAMYNLLNNLSAHSSLFEKLLNFIVVDLSHKTDKNFQQDDLRAKLLYVPTIAGNSPLSLLACLYQELQAHQPFANQLIKRIIEKSSSVQELMILGYIFMHQNVLAVLKKLSSSDQKNVLVILNYVIERYIHEKIGTDHINEIYARNRCIPSLSKRLESISRNIIDNIIQLLNSSKQHTFFDATTSYLCPEVLSSINQQPQFTLIQLFKAHCIGKGLDTILKNNDLDSVQQIAQQQSIHFELGKIMQNIEMGSERNPHEASLIECLQNSIDAARNAYKNQPSISQELLSKIIISLQTMQAQKIDKQHLCVTIKDHAGFGDLKTLLTDFILPDFSSKSPQGGEIGDMGNGSYKIYQRAQHVCVLTRTRNAPNLVYLLLIEPLRNDRGFVYDLALSCHQVNNQVSKDFVGTAIKITYCSQQAEYNTIDLLSLKDFLHNALGATSAKLNDQHFFRIYLQDNNGVLTLLNATPQTASNVVYKHTVGYTPDTTLFSVYKRPHNMLQSYVTTGGIPFRPFREVAKQMNLLPNNILEKMASGYVIDLDLATYQPVQSRTHIQMSNDMKKELRKTLLESFYTIGLHNSVAHPESISPFMHFHSNGSFAQVRLSKYDHDHFQTRLIKLLEGTVDTSKALDESMFFTFYQPLNINNKPQVNFFDYLEDAYATLIPQLNELKNQYQQEGQKKFNDWIKLFKSSVEQEIANQPDELKKNEIRKRWIQHFNTWMNATTLADEWHKKSQQYLDRWMQQHIPPTQPAIVMHTNNHNLIKNAVRTWLDNKLDSNNLSIPSEQNLVAHTGVPALKTSPSNIPNHYDNHNKQWSAWWTAQDMQKLGELLRYTIQSYSNNFLKLLGVQKSCTVTLLYNPQSSMTGSYNDGTKKMNINLHHLDIFEHILLLAIIGNFDAKKHDMRHLTASSAFVALYAPSSGKATTLLHELEHARRHDNLGEIDEHAPHSYGTDVHGNMVDFDSCANTYGIYAMQNGIISAWINDVQTYLAKDNHLKNILYNLITYSFQQKILYTTQQEDNALLVHLLLGQ